MCIAIAKKEGAVIPFEHLEEGAKNNPDGCGLGWLEDGKLQIYKTMFFEEWTQKYFEVIDRCGNIPMLIHFRITSKGETREDMCHPFRIDDDHILIHNGTFSGIDKKDLIDGRSDTSVFAEKIMAGLPDNWEYNESICFLLEDFCGWSKVVILDKDNDFIFLNELGGHWLDDVWYSNKSYVNYSKNYLPARRSDNYNTNDWINDYYKDKNKVANYGTCKDFCEDCNLEFEFNDLIWFDNKLLCNMCFGFASEKSWNDSMSGLGKKDEMDDKFATALEIVEEVERTREVVRKHEVMDCNICEKEYFVSELFTCWIDCDDVDVKGTKDVCKNCFTLLYQMDKINAIEILY